jgi:hypothetical protein
MTREEAATVLNGQEYGSDYFAINGKLFDEMKISGLVAVYGASDDLMEFNGAINDEIDAFNGTTAYLDSHGLIVNNCPSDDCPHFAHMKKNAATIEALWCAEEELSWSFKTDIPHSTFDIFEDGEVFCRGIVFNLNDVVGK